MKYIKNVNSDAELVAYLNCDSIFKLHFNYEPNNLEVGEIIVLYQNPQNIGRCFTHLVVVIDEKVYEDKNLTKHNRYIFVKIISKGIHLINSRSTPNWIGLPHGGYTSGSLVNIANIDAVINNNLVIDLKNEVWNLFFPS